MMLYKLISPSMVKATIQLPASKSISNRALIINALGKGIYPPENLSDCDDTQVMIKALTEGKETIDIMAAGTAMRFLTAYLSATSGERIITGTARMQQRPIQILVNALRELGAEIEYTHNEGYPPLRIKGAELKGNEIRALIINALGKGIYPPENLSDCDDTQVMIKALTEGKETIDIMAAGTAMRFLTAYLSATSGERIITGTARMQQRPIQILVNALRELGAEIEYTHNEGYPPLRIKGAELKGNEITLKGNVSSQYISALLMIGPVLKDGLTLHLTGEIISRPYINLTLQLMQDFGAKAAWTSPSSISVAPQPYQSVPFTVESDWSAASYWYQIAALSPEAEIELLGLFRNSYQGDSRGAEVFSRLGITTEFTPQGVKIKKTGKAPERLEEDFVDIPDLAQTFVVTCALLNIPFRFTGLQSLKIKETDRIAALRTELKKLGYLIEEENDSVLMWNGERCEPEAVPVIATYEDHRMAMAFAPAVITFPKLLIADPQVVSKSYPGYWEDLKLAGFQVINEG